MLITESGEFRKGAIIFEAFVKQLFSHTDLFFSLGAFPHQIYTFALRLLFLGSGLFGCLQGLAGSLRLPKCDSPARVSFFVGEEISQVSITAPAFLQAVTLFLVSVWFLYIL